MNGCGCGPLGEVIVEDDSVGEVEWVVSVDLSLVRAHQHPVDAPKKGAATPGSREKTRTLPAAD